LKRPQTLGISLVFFGFPWPIPTLASRFLRGYGPIRNRNCRIRVGSVFGGSVPDRESGGECRKKSARTRRRQPVLTGIFLRSRPLTFTSDSSGRVPPDCPIWPVLPCCRRSSIGTRHPVGVTNGPDGDRPHRAAAVEPAAVRSGRSGRPGIQSAHPDAGGIS